MFTGLARTYSDVFAPEYFVLLCAITLIVYEWREASGSSPHNLAARFGVLGLGWAVGLAIYLGGPSMVESPPTWAADFTGSFGLGVGILVVWLIWRRLDWGRFVPEFALLLVAVTVPHLVVTPFWDVSSHVAYATVPAGYLATVERRFAPFFAVPVAMVFARPLAGAHTWLQSVGGFVLGGAFVVGLLLLEREQGQVGSDGVPERTAE
jgi:membrane-associated phospholipid phosphatase